ncbi:MAG: sigma-54-dependent Fis family transcriptional regulator [Candidatus Zixiibacteriota bacterium]|nr:MAG: sigma-54-dependent Fis family transcriptional regulator [candidate division Zixibacteria bacterium]
MKNRVVILVDPSSESSREIRWQEIGIVVNQVSELYQTVKESLIDIVLVDDSRMALKYAVAARIRRYNGLTEIWRVVTDGHDMEPDDDFIDGHISSDLGQEGITKKVKQILRQKELLAEFKIVGRSTKMKIVAETIHRIAPTEVPVMIVGPSGSGKELVARAIHDNSERTGKPFVAINCGAIAEGVLESELFGHEKGAFTGSVSKRDGLFHKADSGTIFLDEIGETKPDMQVKLLRVLEDGTYYPVGSSVAQRANVRVVSATNRDLTEAISERAFREDLYFRIGVVKIVLPPLFERANDIYPLLQHFSRSHPGLTYSDSAVELLMKYDWPGNVRQLKNFADRMAALKPKGMVEVEDVERFIEEQHTSALNLPVSTGKTVEQAGQELIYHAILSLGNEIRMLRDLITSHLPSETPPEEYPSDTAEATKGMSMEQMEKLMIEQVLDETKGNRKEAARRLGIGERTLYRKLKKYDLS